MTCYILVLKEAKVRRTTLEYGNALNPGSNCVELLAEQQRFVAVLAKANVVPGLDHVQALLKGTLFLSVHLLVVFVGVCHEIFLISNIDSSVRCIS